MKTRSAAAALLFVTLVCAASEKPSFPGVVALEYSGGRVLCSAVIITDLQILTAAHCVCSELPIYAFIGRSVFPDTGDLGYQTRLNIDLSRVSFMVAGFCERYIQDGVKAARSGDLALLFLEERLPLEVQPAILFDGMPSPGGVKFTEIIAVGWGESDNFWRPGRKNYAVVQLSVRLCSDVEEAAHGCKADQEAIAADPPRDTCYADSGGALYGLDEGGVLHLFAITSRALRPSINNLCGAGGIYTSLESPAVRSWLAEELTATYRGGRR